MERSGEDVCVLLPPPPPGLRDREPDLTIPVGGGVGDPAPPQPEGHHPGEQVRKSALCSQLEPKP